MMAGSWALQNMEILLDIQSSFSMDSREIASFTHQKLQVYD